MIFKSIRLKNFRQYKNELIFDFSQPKDGKENISLLIAANGVGKTTLLQAFRYCFYGKSSNYLNLPKADELINNTIIDDLKDLDETKMFVEVKFTHENIEYIAMRETTFYKVKSILKETGKEQFSLTQLTDKDGYKPFKEAEANDKIRSILPEGLSQVFMFDGERMERSINDKKFSNELKESILGILDLKKYDKLIEIIGYQGKVNSVIGILSSKKKTKTEEERKNKSNYDTLVENKSTIEKDIENSTIEIAEINKKININREQQEKLEENRNRVQTKAKKEDEIEILKNQVNELSLKYIKESKQVLVYKLLIQNKRKYDDFIHTGKKHDNFYAYLHVDTIQDIQDKRMCVCGRPISEHGTEFLRLEELKKSALPIESSQHLNLIDQKFKQCAGFNVHMEVLKGIRNQIKTLNNEISKLKDEVHVLTQEISKVEKQMGLSNQDEIETLLELRDKAYTELGSKNERLKTVNDLIKRLEKKIEVIDKNSEYNQKVNQVINNVQRIKDKLEKIKNDKDVIARNILAKNFNNLLSKTIHGMYDVTIDQKYQLRILDLGNNKEVTNALNTGHNVVISLTFISALIQTAKELSATMNKDEKYGVLMDAALSNLDEVHIDRLCRNTLNNLDQLIFLSFKRQLRDEMYMGIKDHIGQAYEIKKNIKGDVFYNKLDLENLSTYIHLIEEE
jgi:DNA sulfur modification protein DndD